MFVLGEIRFETLRQFTPGQQYMPSATPAFESYIRAQTDNRPFIRAAWMLFAQTQVIVKLKIRQHKSNC